MFIRTLFLGACLAVALAVGVAVAPAKVGEKGTITIPAIPGITQTAIDFACAITLEQGRVFKLDCHNTGGPYAYPPKDKKVYKVSDNSGRATLTLYPDGQVTLIEYRKN
jgi:hypothetical protein